MTSERNQDSSALIKRSLLELRRLRARIAELEGCSKEPIAIIGLGCRFPGGAHDPSAFWKLLIEGRDAISEMPADRLDLRNSYDPDPTAPGKAYAREGGFLEQVDGFDAHFFRIPPREATSLDPQQRMLLEVSWEALEDAGQAPDRLYGSHAGVFIGIGGFEYAAHLLRSIDPAMIDPYFGTGTALSAAAGRLSFTLGLTGPSMAVDTACSSSLVALHLACQSLRSRECNLALAGGVNLLLAPEVNIAFAKAHLLSTDGRCKTFDAAADGYVRGEGCGVVVLKRLSDALTAGDRIVALVRGSAVNQDGPSGALVVPNGISQQSVIREALENAGVATSELDYIEAHGTGTSLGDPIEMGALGQVFGKDRRPDHPLIVGSVKTNIGHLESAAGVAGLIKVALALQHETIPAHLHFRQPNPQIPWELVATVIPTEARPWPRGTRRRLAGISSFGFTGTNAHAILEEAPVPEAPPARPERGVHVLTLSAKTEAALRELAVRFECYLASATDLDAGDLCFTANTGRARFRQRLAIVAGSIAEFRGKLADFIARREAPGIFSNSADSPKQKTAFLFTDQGVEYTGMGRELYDTHPGFRATLDRCEKILQPLLEKPLLDVLFSHGESSSLIHDPLYAHPALFALQLGLAELWQSWGVRPDAVFGQNFGEYAAACVAGVFKLEDGLKLVARQARLMQERGGDSRLMAACDDDVRLALPRIRMVSSLTGQAAAKEFTTAEYWNQEGRCAGQFAEAMQSLRSIGCRRFVEISPEPVLLSSGRDCLPGEAITWIPSLRKGQSDWRQLGEGVALLSTQDLAVDWAAFDRDYHRRRVTLPTYPFQRERFWIQPARRETLDGASDLYYRIDWQPQAVEDRQAGAVVPGMSARGRWLILADRTGVGEALAAHLRAEGEECLLAFAGMQYERTAEFECTINPGEADDFARLLNEGSEDRPAFRGIVHLWGLDRRMTDRSQADEIGTMTELGCGAALHLVQALVRKASPGLPGLWLITRGAQPIASGPVLEGLAQATLWGLGSAIAVELPQLRCTLIDLDPAGGEPDVRTLFDELRRDDVPTGEPFAFRAGQRYVRRLVRCQKPEPQPVALRPDRSYLVSGGLGGIGLLVARWMADNGARHLVLLGRTGSSETADEAIAQMRRQGVEVVVLRADVAQADEVATVLNRIRDSMPPLSGLIHCAGVFNDRLLVQHKWELFVEAFAPKVAGAWNLHSFTREMELDFFVLFSSSASLLPAPGMSGYIAANAFQDALAPYRQMQGLPALSISWGPWEDVGMAHRAGRSQQNQWRRHGLEALSPQQALEALGRLLRHRSGHVGVFSVNWPELLGMFSGLPVPAYLEQVAAGAKPKGEGKESRVFRELLEKRPEERTRFLESYLKEHLARLLGIDISELSNLRNLPEAGIDSLMIMDVLNALRDDLKFMLYPREFYEQPTIQGLAKYLAAEFERAHGQSAGQTATVQAPATEAALSFPNLLAMAATDRFSSDVGLEPLPGIAFVLSSPRAGSTLLRVMLAGHPDLFSPPELHLLPFSTMGERSRYLQKTHLGEGLQRALMSLLDLGVEASGAMIEDWVAQDLPIREVYSILQKRAHPRLLVDKSPSHAATGAILARAERLFGAARYIHLVRHPYAVIESFVRLRMERLLGAEAQDPHAVAEEIWTTTNRNVLDVVRRAAPERYHRVYYEQLVSDPKALLTDCCEFLGVPFHEAVLEVYASGRMTEGLHAVSAAIDDPNFLKHDRIEKHLGEHWKQIDLGRPLKAATRALAAELGYDLPHDHGRPLVVATELKAAEPPAPRGWDMEEHYVETVRGLRLCLCTWGPEEGPLVLLLHGILAQGASWMELAESLSTRGFRVVAPDLRGHGRSDHVGLGGSYHLIDFVADLDAIAAKLSSAPFTLVGHSLGSVIAALFTSARPDSVASLVLVEPLLPTEGRADGVADGEKLATQLDYLAGQPRHPVLADLETAASRVASAVPGLSPTLALKLAVRDTVSGDAGLQWRWDPLLRTRAGIGFSHEQFSRARYIELLRQLRPPLTMVFGNQSNMRRDDGLLLDEATLPGARVVVLVGGHNIHLDQPAMVAETIAQALMSPDAMRATMGKGSRRQELCISPGVDLKEQQT